MYISQTIQLLWICILKQVIHKEKLNSRPIMNSLELEHKPPIQLKLCIGGNYI